MISHPSFPAAPVRQPAGIGAYPSGGSRNQRRPGAAGGGALVLVLALAAVLALALVAVVVARPAYHKFRNYLTDKNLQAAEEAQAAGNWLAARDLARSVLLVRPGGLPAVRILYRAMRELEDPTAIDAAYGLFLNPQSTLEDKAAALEVFADDAPHAVFLATYFSLAPEQRRQPAVLAPAMRFLVARRQPAEALKLWAEAGEGAQAAPPVRVEKMRALCAASTPAGLAEARSIFLGLRGEAGPEALAALRLLGPVKGGLDIANDFPDLKDWIAARADATPLDHLFVLQQQLVARPAEAKPLVDQAIALYRAQAPAALGGWLQHNGFVDEAIAMLADAATRDTDAFVTRIQCLVKAGRAAEAKEALAQPPTGIDKVKLHTVEAAVEAAAGDPAATAKALRAALDEAKADNNRNHFLKLAVYAAALGMKDMADEAMVNAIRLGRGSIPLYANIQPLLARLARQGRTEDILGISRVMLFYEPMNPAIRNNFVYLACLHRVMPPVEACTELAALAEARPDLPEVLGSLAMARLMASQPAEARETLARVDTSRTPADFRLAIDGTATALLGEDEAARATLGRVNWRQMLPQEAIVFRDLLATGKAAALPMPDVDPKGSYDVKPLGEWQESLQPKLHDLPPTKPVRANYPVVDLEKWRELHQRQDENKRKAGEKWMGDGWKAGDGE